MKWPSRLVFALSIFMFGFSHASDIELMTGDEAPRHRHEYVVINLEPADHQDPDHSAREFVPPRFIPNDVWRSHILPNLDFISRLRLSYTNSYFHNISNDSDFLYDKRTFFALVLAGLIHQPPEGVWLLDYVDDLRVVFNALQGYDYSRFPYQSHARKRFQMLWNLRYIPGISVQAIERGDQAFTGFRTPSLRDVSAAKLTGHYFKNRQIKFFAGAFYTTLTCAAVMLVSGQQPNIHLSNLPWIELQTPAYPWRDYLGNEPIYGINTLDLLCNRDICFTANKTATIASSLLHRQNLTGLTSYLDGMSFNAIPFYLSIGVPWVALTSLYVVVKVLQPNQAKQFTLKNADHL